MAKYTLNMTVDASLTKVCTVNIKDNVNEWFATIIPYGTFGSGTVTLFVSPDGGTTKVPLKDAQSGTAMSTTAGAMFTARLGNGSANSDKLIIYATLAGSTNANLNIAVFDNAW